MTTPRLPIFHLRRSIRLQGQETRRAQRQAQAAHDDAVHRFAVELAESHHAAMRELAADMDANAQAIAAAEGPPEVLAGFRRKFH